MTCWFRGFSNQTEIAHIENLRTNSVTSMTFTFANCSSLKEIDLSNFDGSSLTQMVAMFENCNLLKELDLSRLGDILYQELFQVAVV